MGKPTLYYTTMSAPCRAVILLIRELDLDVNLEKVDYANNEHLSEDYIKMNPQHTIPLLDDDGYYLWESKAIMIYLINKYAPDTELFPRDPKVNGTLMQRLFFDHNTFEKLKEIIAILFKHPKNEVINRLKLEFHHILEFMEKFLEDREWFVTEKPTIADLCVLASFSTIYHCGFKLDDYPKLLKFYENSKVFKGYEENEEGAPLLGHYVKQRVPEGF